MRRLRIGGFALLALALGAPAAARFPSVAETRAELEAVCRRLTEGGNLYFGAAQIEPLERRLRDPVEDPEIEAMLRARFAAELIRLDRLDDAVRESERGLELMASRADALPEEFVRQLTLTAGLAHFFRGERQNCVERHVAASCILPIAPEAVHALPEHVRRAGDIFREYLERRDPEDLQVRWLLNVARMVTGDYPEAVPERFRLPPGALTAAAGGARWRDVAPALGVDGFDLSGGGVMDDFDGDGLLDLVSSSWDPCEPMKAFRNDGRGGFEDVTAAWGLDGQLGGLNLVQADFDDDGRLDLLVLRGAWLGNEGRIRNSLLRNDLDREAGRFVDVTAAAGLAYPAYPTQTGAWADYDGDGDLDLYVGNEATASSTDPISLSGKAGNPFPSQLFRNNGDGTFTDVARSAGVDNRRFAKGVAWGDYDNDGDPDLYVSNLGPNRLYRNDGDGGFSDVAEALGVSRPARESFPTWFFDYDNDGDLDLFVAAFRSPPVEVSATYLGYPSWAEEGPPVLYRNELGPGGERRFVDVSAEAGLNRPLLPMGANYGDLDNDGWLDFYLGTGLPAFESLMPNVMYRNERGVRFEDVTFDGGFGHLQKGHGVAFGDLDNDGDQDIFEQMGGAFPFDAYGNVLYLNPGSGHRWLVLRLEGVEANRFGVGARIEVRVREAGGSRPIHLLVGASGSFGGSSLQQEIGLGPAEAIEAVTIVWPGSGTRQVFREVPPDAFYRVVEGRDRLERLAVPVIELATDPKPHRHPSAPSPPR